MHFSWFNFIPFMDPHYTHIASAVLAMIIIFILANFARLALNNSPQPEKLSPKFSIKAVFEMLIDFVEAISRMVLGESNHFSVPIFATIFLIIFINNLICLIPGLMASTQNINTTLSFGIFSFLLYNFYGFKANGWNYFKQFLGPIIFLAPLMLVVELVSHIVRPFSLGLRLSGNLEGDHTVLSIFLDLLPVGVPVIFYFLAIFICFIQAFVFMILSMIYLSMSMAHDH